MDTVAGLSYYLNKY